MSIPPSFLAPVLRSKPSATASAAPSSKLPPLGRNGAVANTRGLPSEPPIQKPGRKMLSARGVPGEAGAQVSPPMVPQGFAPSPALPSRDLVGPPVPPGERYARSDRGAPPRQARALPSKLVPLPVSENLVPAAPSQRGGEDSTLEARTSQDVRSSLMSESSDPKPHLLPEVQLLDSQFNTVSSQLRQQTTQLLESQNALQRKAESLEQMLNETCTAKEAEVAHSRKLAEAFSRESARCEDVRQEVETARLEKQILQSELDDLQIKRFRATELASHSGIDQELLMVLKAENEALLEELRHMYARPDVEEDISLVSRELAQNEPKKQQLRKGLTDAYVHNTELQQQNSKLSAQIDALREELGISETAPELCELLELYDADDDWEEEQCVSMSIDPAEEEMQVSLRIHVPRCMANLLAATM